MSAEQCSKTIYGGNAAWGGSRCSRAGKVEVNGRWFCGVHSPEGEQKRQAKRDAKYQSYERQHACVNAFHSKDGRTIPTERITPGVFWLMRDTLQVLEPHLGAIVDYASTMEEHEPNRIAFNVHALLATLKVEEPET